MDTSSRRSTHLPAAVFWSKRSISVWFRIWFSLAVLHRSRRLHGGAGIWPYAFLKIRASARGRALVASRPRDGRLCRWWCTYDVFPSLHTAGPTYSVLLVRGIVTRNRPLNLAPARVIATQIIIARCSCLALLIDILPGCSSHHRVAMGRSPLLDESASRPAGPAVALLTGLFPACAEDVVKLTSKRLASP